MSSLSIDQKVNLSQIEIDPLGNVTDDQINYYEEMIWHYMHIVTELTKFAVILLILTIDGFLIHIIRKTPKLNTRINKYILHYAIGDLVYHLSTGPILFIFHFMMHIHRHYYVIVQVEIAALLFRTLLMSCLALDWYWTSFVPNIVAKLGKAYDNAIPILYFAIFVHWFGFSIFSLLSSFAYIEPFVIDIGYISSFIVLVVINFKSRNVVLNKTSFALKIASFYVFSLTPLFVSHYTFYFIDDYSSRFVVIFFLFHVCAEILSYSSSIYIAYVLWKENKYFKMAFDKVFCRSVKNYDDNEYLDDSSEDAVTANADQTVVATTHKIIIEHNEHINV